MNKHAAAIVLSVVLAVGTAGTSYAAGAGASMLGSPLNVREGANVAPQGGMPPSVVRGELVRIDGRDYVVKDQFGKEIRFQLDERTRMSARPRVGDKITADVEPQGYAYSINIGD